MGHYFKRGFVSFREYTIIKKNENKVVIANVEKVNKETALPNFNSGIVVVDDINIQKKIIPLHFRSRKNWRYRIL